MSIMTNKIFAKVRTCLRSLGIVSFITKLLKLIGIDYETLFTRSMVNVLKNSDCVWDVGANIGYYTQIFARAVGESGHVYAFEPHPATMERLRAALGLFSNVTMVPLALSDRAGVAAMNSGDHADLATARVCDEGNVAIEMQTADAFIGNDNHKVPSIIKIDVEGHELDVLKGIPLLLKSPRLKHIFIEVHFAIFEATNRSGTPKKIETLLKSEGFRLRWLDYSHVHAYRA